MSDGPREGSERQRARLCIANSFPQAAERRKHAVALDARTRGCAHTTPGKRPQECWAVAFQHLPVQGNTTERATAHRPLVVARQVIEQADTEVQQRTMVLAQRRQPVAPHGLRLHNRADYCAGVRNLTPSPALAARRMQRRGPAGAVRTLPRETHGTARAREQLTRRHVRGRRRRGTQSRGVAQS